MQGGLLGVSGYARNDAATLALNHSHDWSFGLVNHVAAFGAPANIHFVDFHRRSLQLQILRQQSTNLPEYAPRGFVGDASLALDLLCGDSATGRTHEVHSLKPDSQRSAGLLKDGSRQRVHVMPAVIAGIRSATSHAVMLADRARAIAGVTLRHAARKAHFHHACKASIVGREVLIELTSVVSEFFRNGLSDAVHGKNSMPFVLLVVKG